MKKPAKSLLTLVLLILAAVPGGLVNPGTPETSPYESCSVFNASDGEVVLVGNNEDFLDPLPKVWFLPPEGGKFGRVYFGFENQYQGGMNDQGLFFDSLAVEPIEIAHDDSKPVHQGVLYLRAMEECATVACVLELYERFNSSGTNQNQIFVADATGDAAVIELPTVLSKSGSYQVATNFRQSTTEAITCERYQTADAMLANADAYTVDLFRDILNAVQNAAGGTTYSNIYDLKRRTVHVYFYHDFEHEVVINLDDELKKGPHAYDLPALFPRNEVFERWARPQIEAFEKELERRTATDVDPQIYDRYVGEYAVPPEIGWISFPPAYFSSIHILRAADRLFVSLVPEMLPLELRPESETRFYYADLSPDIPDFEVSFVVDENENVTRAIIDIPGVGAVPFQKISSQTPTLAQVQLLTGEAATREPSGLRFEQIMWLLVPVAVIFAAVLVWRRVRGRLG